MQITTAVPFVHHSKTRFPNRSKLSPVFGLSEFTKRLGFLFAFLLVCRPAEIFPQSPELNLQNAIRLSLPGKQPARQRRFTSISVNLQGDIYLLDAARNSVVRFDGTGRFLREVGGFGWRNEEFDQPAAIWAENGLDVFVADYNNNRIQRFDRKLNFVAAIPGEQVDDPRLQFAFPIAVCLSDFGELFIAEREHNRILRLDAEFKPEQSFGDYDWGAGVLASPVSIGVFSGESVFVADNERQSVIRFDYYGTFLSEISIEKFGVVSEIAVSKEFVFVLLENSKKLLLFTHDGRLAAQKNVFEEPRKTPKVEGVTSLALARNMLYLLDGARNIVLSYILEK